MTRVVPSSGSTFGFTRVLVEGHNLSPGGEACFFFSCKGVTVDFGENEAFLLFASPERDVVLSPLHKAGTVDVTVTVNGKTSATTPADRYTYQRSRFFGESAVGVFGETAEDPPGGGSSEDPTEWRSPPPSPPRFVTDPFLSRAKTAGPSGLAVFVGLAASRGRQEGRMPAGS